MKVPDRHELEPFEQALADAWPPHNWQDAHVVLAVSAGADSVAMLRALSKVKRLVGGQGILCVAHLNHLLRSTAADDDEAWLTELCGRLGISLEVDRVDVAAMALDQGDGCEAAGREARYEFLEKIAERIGARYVAVAHTADDQTETVLHRILRGTGLAGLAGIPFARPLCESVTLVRPLLETNRSEVIRYLTAIGQDYRTDETNADPRHTRNRIRRELLPMLRAQYNPGMDDALRRLAAQANDAQHVVGNIADNLVTQCVTMNSDVPCSIRIDCRPLAGQPLYLVREVFRAAWKQAKWPLQSMRFHEWQVLAGLFQSHDLGAVVNLPSNVRAKRVENEVVLERFDLGPVRPSSC
jgi:tRNA(Ile)-lysidine synthase